MSNGIFQIFYGKTKVQKTQMAEIAKNPVLSQTPEFPNKPSSVPKILHHQRWKNIPIIFQNAVQNLVNPVHKMVKPRPFQES